MQKFRPLFNAHSTSFWDEFNSSNLTTNFEGIFQIKIDQQFQNVFIKVQQHYLIMIQGDKYKYSNIENCLIFMLMNEQKEIGLKIIKGNTNLEIYGEVSDLYSVLRKQCIQTDFVLKYKVRKLMAKGTFANVYHFIQQVFLAENLKTREQFAVKCFDKKIISANPKDLQSLQQELKILRLMRNRQVLALIETFETVSYVFLIHEHLKGGDLHEYLQKSGQLSEKKVNCIMQQLVNGLSFIHSQGIIHRDLKPENIILRNQDSIEDLVISDFGLADFYKFDCSYLYKQCGTPGYVAPEILMGLPYDFKVDVYSLGVLFFTMITGRRPFNGKHQEQIFQLNEKGEINFQNVHFDGLNLLKKMLEFRPEHRYSLNMVKQHIWFKKYSTFKPQLSLQYISVTDQMMHGNTTPRLQKIYNPKQSLKTEQTSSTERKHHKQFGNRYNLSIGNFTHIQGIYS